MKIKVVFILLIFFYSYLFSISIDDIRDIINTGDIYYARVQLSSVNSFQRNSNEFYLLATEIYYRLDAFDSAYYYANKISDKNIIPLEISGPLYIYNNSFPSRLSVLIDAYSEFENKNYIDALILFRNAKNLGDYFDINDYIDCYIFKSTLFSGDTTEAIVLAEKFIKKYNSLVRVEILKKLGEIQFYNDKLVVALEYLEDIPSENKINYILGEIYIALSMEEQAVSALNKALSSKSIYSDSSWIILSNINKADTLIRVKSLSLRRKYSEIITLLTQYTKENPSSNTANYYIGRSYRKLGNYSKALEYLKRIRSGEYFCYALFNIGLSYMSLNEIYYEKLSWETFINNCNSGNLYDDALFNLAKISLKEGDTTSAISYLKKIIESDENYDMIPSAANLFFQILSNSLKQQFINSLIKDNLTNKILPLLYFAADNLPNNEQEKIYNAIIEYNQLSEYARRSERKLLEIGYEEKNIIINFNNEEVFQIDDDVKYHCNKAKILYACGMRDNARLELSSLKDINLDEKIYIASIADFAGDRYIAIQKASACKYYYNILPSKIFFILYPQAFRLTIEKYSKKYNIPVEILQGLIRTESLFDNKISSHAGAVGLAQLMPSTAKYVAEKLELNYYNLFNPDHNIFLGSYYLQEQYNYFGRMEVAISAYNAGPGNANRWKNELNEERFIDNITFSETRAYVPKVLTTAWIYNKIQRRKFE